MLAAPFRARLYGTILGSKTVGSLLFSWYKTQLPIQTLSHFFFFFCAFESQFGLKLGGGDSPAAATETTVQVEARDALGQKTKTTQNKELIEFEIVAFVLIFMFQCFFCSSTWVLICTTWMVTYSCKRTFYGIQLRDSDRSLDREIIRKFVRRPIIYVVTDNIKILRVLYFKI